MKEMVIAKLSALDEGRMKAFPINDEDKVMLIKFKGGVHAFGEKCPHYGADLADGALINDRIVCPWHHAAFDPETGTLIEPPANNDLPVYETRIDGDDIIIILPDQMVSGRIPQMARRDLGDERVFAILGAGSAGSAAAQALREAEFQGRVLMITREDRRPYDRPKLSKDYLEGASGDSDLPIRDDDYYAGYDIEVALNRKVERLDTHEKIVRLSDGADIKYDAALIATGGIPRPLNVPGANLKNVFTLRSWGDSALITEAATKSTNVVVVGTGFIGLEAACSLRKRGLDVTVIGPETPFKHVLGAELGNLFRESHEANGVKFRLGDKVTGFRGAGEVGAVALDSGDEIQADLVIVGIGVKPATDFAHDLTTLDDGSFLVDDYQRVSETVYAAGDVATFTYWFTGEQIRIEHWRAALQQGRTAGFNMAGRKTPFRSVPFFWTNQFDLFFRYVGHATKWDRIIFGGDLKSRAFIAYYVYRDRIIAAAGVNRDKEMAVIEELMRSNRMPTPGEVEKPGFDIL